MKREKKLFELPSLTSIEGKMLSINDLGDIEDAFTTCDNGCDDGCSSGVGAGTKAKPGLLKNCDPCSGSQHLKQKKTVKSRVKF